jgi:hypothetical protein
MKDAFLALLRSRKFLLAVLAVVHTLVAHYMNIPADVWMAINVLLGVVIAGIAIEDAALKSGRGGPYSALDAIALPEIEFTVGAGEPTYEDASRYLDDLKVAINTMQRNLIQGAGPGDLLDDLAYLRDVYEEVARSISRIARQSAEDGLPPRFEADANSTGGQA